MPTLSRLLCISLALGLASLFAESQASFSKSLSREDYLRAGLDRLSPEQRDTLDALVARTGPASRAPAPVEEAKPSKEPVARLAPGTQVEFTSVESRIEGSFTGWEGQTLFRLQNGQRWRASNAGRYYCAPIESPAVVITPGIMGSFWMRIEGVSQKVRVMPLP